MHTDKTINFSTKPFCPKCGREIPTDEIVAEKDRAWCPNCRREMSFVEVADYSLVKTDTSVYALLYMLDFWRGDVVDCAAS